MKAQLQIKDHSDTSQKRNPGQTEEHPATASRKGKFFVMTSSTFSSASERDGGRKASHPSLSSREAGSK